VPPPNGMIEINRPRADVFNYATDPRVRPDWQDAVQEIEVETTLPYGRGSRVRERRQAQGRLPTYRWEVIEYEPPRRWSFHGIDGPVRAIATMTFTELGDAERTLVNFEIDFEGSGFGRLIAILARRGARKEIPLDLANLKRRVEAET